MRAIRIPAALTAVFGLAAATAAIMSWPLERAIYLAPVLVVGAAAVIGLVLLWGKVALQAIRDSKRPRLVVALWLAGFALIALLTFLGIKLPREG
ncbi:MAG TPA: hypothetical protein VKP14_02200 [Gaiellaceae bacterium]|nr:hypothetical protein [Gaiellaceae bacterium]